MRVNGKDSKLVIDLEQDIEQFGGDTSQPMALEISSEPYNVMIFSYNNPVVKLCVVEPLDDGYDGEVISSITATLTPNEMTNLNNLVFPD